MQIYTKTGIHWLDQCDRVLVPITPLQMSMHHAIYIGYYNQEPYFIENKIGIGVHLISAKEFFKRNPIISTVKKFSGNGQQRQHALERSFALLGMPYDLINYNCEHFANEVQHMRSYSDQMKVAGVIGVLAVIFMIASAE
jgi:Permuted papain-like amidase enzyme, YaeF/YiiX, C92 family